jgi:hypothetical protein
MTAEPNFIGALSESYAKKPLVKALLKLVPGGSSADTLFQKRADELKAERQRIFFDELAKGKQDFSAELLESNEFVHAFFCTLRAVMNARHEDKIRAFARLLTAKLEPGEHVGDDEHEEMIRLLESVTAREFGVLYDLKHFELQEALAHSDLEERRIANYWDSFAKAAVEKYSIDEKTFPSFMSRLEATGLFLRDSTLHYGAITERGTTTLMFDRLCSFIAPADRNVPKP